MLVKMYPQEKGLTFGLNKYPGAELRGCVNDSEDMANEQVRAYDWDPGNIRLLTDFRCTRKEMFKRLEWLVDVKKGDRVFFHQSGHGVQFPSRSYSGEPDGLLEAFCPIDFAWCLDGMVTDKDYVEFFSRIPRGVEFTWVNDSCHSGDLTRAQPGNPHGPTIVPRSYPVPEDIAWRHKGLKTRNIKSMERAMVCGKMDVGFVSASRSDQTAADTFVNGRPCGALTHYFLQTLRGNRQLPLETVVSMTRDTLRAQGYTQEPQAEGRRVDKPFMINRAVPGAPGAVGCISQTGPTGPVEEQVGVTHASTPESHLDPVGPGGVTGVMGPAGTYLLPFDKEGAQNVCPHCGKTK